MCNQGLDIRRGTNFLAESLIERAKQNSLMEQMQKFGSAIQNTQQPTFNSPARLPVQLGAGGFEAQKSQPLPSLQQGQTEPNYFSPSLENTAMQTGMIPQLRDLQKANSPNVQLINQENGGLQVAKVYPGGKYSVDTITPSVQKTVEDWTVSTDKNGQEIVRKNQAGGWERKMQKKTGNPASPYFYKYESLNEPPGGMGGMGGSGAMTPFKLWQTDHPTGSYDQWLKDSKNVDSNQLKVMKEAAPKVKRFVDILTGKIEAGKDNMGVMASRWREFMQGKIGAKDPEFAKIKTDKSLLATLLMRMHMGGRGGMQGIEYFNSMLDVGMQSPENLLGILQEVGDYANSLSDSTGSGSTSPKAGDVEDGFKFKGGNPADPNNWEKQK